MPGSDVAGKPSALQSTLAVLDQLEVLSLRVRQLHRSKPVALSFVKGIAEERAEVVHLLSVSREKLRLPVAVRTAVILEPPSGAGYDAVRAMFNAIRSIERASIPAFKGPPQVVAAVRQIGRLVENVRAILHEDAVFAVQSPLHRGVVERQYLRQILEDRRMPESQRASSGTCLVDRLFDVLSVAQLSAIRTRLEEALVGSASDGALVSPPEASTADAEASKRKLPAQLQGEESARVVAALRSALERRRSMPEVHRLPLTLRWLLGELRSDATTPWCKHWKESTFSHAFNGRRSRHGKTVAAKWPDALKMFKEHLREERD